MFRLAVSLFFSMLIFVNCNKPDASDTSGPTPNPTPQNPTPPASRTKVRRLIGVNASLVCCEESLTFNYDSLGVLRSLRTTEPGYTQDSVFFYYKDNLISYSTYSYSDVNRQYLTKSVIFLYNSNKKCNKVVYKKPFGSYNAANPQLIGTNPYYSDVSDGQLDNTYDSLTYTSSGQTSEILTFVSGKLREKTKFYYRSSSDTSLTKIEQYQIRVLNGNPELYLDALVTLGDVDNPAYKDGLWFLPFVRKMSSLGCNVVCIPLNSYNFPSETFSFIPKMIKKYVAHNYDPSFTDDSPQFQFKYNTDSTRLTVSNLPGGLGTPKFDYNYGYR